MTPPSHYLRVLALILGLCAAVLTAGTLVLWTAARSAETSAPLGSMLLAALLWSGVLAVVAFGVSSVVPRGDGAVAALYLLASFLQVALLESLAVHATWLRRAISWVLVPVDPLADAWRGLLGTSAGPDEEGWARIALFGAAWLAIACGSLARMGRAEMPLRE